MDVLVTGATGFAGRHLGALCASLGHTVHALVRPGREGAVGEGVVAHAASVTDAAAVAEVVRRVAPDRIVHLAGASSVGRSFADPAGTWEVNLGGTIALLEALRLHATDVPALVVTSGEIHGRVPLEDLPVTADTPLRPVSPYGASKAAADLAALQYRASYGVRAIRVRAFNHVGPGQDARFVLPNVARQIAAAELAGRDGVEVRVGNVETRRDFIDVRDMVRAYWLLLERGDPDAVYLACGGRSMPVRELVEGLAGIARIPVTVSSDPALRREGEQPDLYGSPERLRADTGWSPEIPIQTTLADTLDWWRERVAAGED
ncbi:GDP-mannose 4,6-dehydratase [Miltoncostaea marina]|uniref:GDP-mannose 4,6-dehydratase n=1 Tax=Miltoncostaea marina TaxID=2843215 RepID=UPI001C3E5233|nr:GDP-mannose 4,6-dehydratase [Miltoncostaea marina]